MKTAESAAPPEPEQFTPPPPVEDTSEGDPLDDLLGDFSAPSPEKAPSDDSEDDTGVKMVGDDLSTDFGQSSSSHSKRKRVRKVKKVKRPRKSP